MRTECAECGGTFRGDGLVAAPHGPICGECFASACIRGEAEDPDDGLAFDGADLPQWWRVQAGRPEAV